jgi:hypothetical protein
MDIYSIVQVQERKEVHHGYLFNSAGAGEKRGASWIFIQ